MSSEASCRLVTLCLAFASDTCFFFVCDCHEIFVSRFGWQWRFSCFIVTHWYYSGEFFPSNMAISYFCSCSCQGNLPEALTEKTQCLYGCPICSAVLFRWHRSHRNEVSMTRFFLTMKWSVTTCLSYGGLFDASASHMASEKSSSLQCEYFTALLICR